MRNQKGITLVALVVTIVVLLILAGVSIAMLSGDNGILTQATKAADETKVSEQREIVINAINELTAEYYEKKYVSSDNTLPDTVGAYIGANLATHRDVTGVLSITKDNDTTPTKLTIQTTATYKDGKVSQAEYTISTGKLGEWTKAAKQ